MARASLASLAHRFYKQAETREDTMDAVALLTGRRGSLARWLTLLTLTALISTFGDRVVFPVVRAQSAPVGAGLVLDAGDLRFIFRQIQISQIHSAAATASNQCATLVSQIVDIRLPFGLRTVDGSCNHLESDKTEFGASDNLFPRMTTQQFRAGQNHVADFDGPGPVVVGQPSSYLSNGSVTDARPRIISNLIVDQTTTNPAAAAAAGAAPELVDEDGDGMIGPGETTFFIPNVAPDEGLSAPFNSMFTFFGQFFDHGLDLLNKGGNGIVYVPLQADDPLVTHGPDGIQGNGDEVPPDRRFMVLTRGTRTTLPGPDNVLGTGDDLHEGTNQTSPFVDQNQTYTSHPSHQVFLREYERVDDPTTPAVDVRTRSTGRMIDSEVAPGAGGHIGTWGDVKLQAAQMLGILLNDQDVFNVPLLATDAYGYFKRGPARQLPQIVLSGGVLLEGNVATPVAIPANAVRTGHAFLDDIAHLANPFGDHDNNPATPSQALLPDIGSAVGNDDMNANTYDDELLNRHHVTGDGRGNENIALTAVHTIFHSEHNRLRNNIDCLINGPNLSNNNACPASIVSAAERTGWLGADGPSGWDRGERLFQAAKFATEMQYQHLVFEEFARKLVPSINEFIGDGINFSSSTNPSIVAEFAHQTYRLGHSMLTESISRVAQDGTPYDISLIDGFLNPLAFSSGATGEALDASHAAGAIWRGGTRQVGNHIDEFVTEAVRNNLLGLPLDLPVFNLARGRDQGIAPLNEVRRQLFLQTGDFAVQPYDHWFDFSFSLKNSASLVNFIAAYGTHPTIVSATTLAAKRAAAFAIVNAVPLHPFLTQPAATSGLNDVDLWVGGLAEQIHPFGGMLGSTFTVVLETQLENLQNADRFYYLERLDGLNFLVQLEGNSFVELIQRNTTLNGDASAAVFDRPDFVFNLDAQPLTGPTQDDPTTPDVDESVELVRMTNGGIRYNGAAHVIWNGRDSLTNPDRLVSSIGDDTLRGNGGNDIMEGGAGNDNHIGGDGDDILTDTFGEDVIKGGPGHDAISGGSGPFDLLQGNAGDDFIIGGNDSSEVFGGSGNDVMYVGKGLSESFGGAGDDWIEGSDSPASVLVGDENNQFQNDPTQGNDVILAGPGDADFDSEGGDDIMVANVTPTHRLEGMLGWDAVTYRGETLPVDADMRIRVVLPPELDENRDRFDLTEALSGSDQADILHGDDRGAGALEPESSMVGHELTAAKVDLLWVNPPPDSPSDPPAGNTLRTFLNAFGVVLPFSSGNILLGGAGADVIEGRGGDDLIDGNAWLNVQLRAPNAATPATTDFRRVASLQALKNDVFAGLVNPGSIDIVRTIVVAVDNPALVRDVALFSGPIENYTISGPTAGIVTVTDNTGVNGTDKLRNIEVLRFVPDPDQPNVFEDVTIGNNAPPTGTPTLSQPNPQQDEALTINGLNTITDPNTIPGGVASFTFQWQQTEVGVTGFVNILGATLATFTPDDDQVGQTIRALVSFRDGGGRRETIPTPPSGIVGANFVGTAANETFNGTAGRDAANGAGGNDTLTTLGGDDSAQGGPGNDTIDTGAGADLAAGGAGDDTINTGAGNDTIRFNGAEGFDAINGGLGTDAIVVAGAGAVIGLSSLANVETITGAGAGVSIVGSEAANTFDFTAVTLTLIDRIQGAGGADAITGSGVADRIDGGAGADTLNGGGGADDLNGDAGADTINGGAGSDTINGGAGNDSITGGIGNDTLQGDPAANTVGTDMFRFGTGFGNDTINGFGAVPSLTVGQDLLNVNALGITTAALFTANVTVAPNGANTLITIRIPGTTTVAGTILLNGVAAANVTIADFSVAP
jgi:Ca2+-binding RTX toxin-like protein